MKEIAIILFSAILVENFVLSKFLGVCPFLGVSKKLSSATGMGMAVTFVMVMASALTWPIYHLVLMRYELGYLFNVAFILIIALFVQIVEMVLKKFVPSLYRALGVYLPLITTNCAVLGVTILNIDKDLTFVLSIINALGAGMGFLLAMTLFAGVRERMEHSNIPKALQGIPITLIAASIVSLSFAGFAGLVENLFK